MPVSNWTTEVPVSRTVAAIHQLLVTGGVHNISSDYEGGAINGITFTIRLAPGPVTFRLPCKWRATLAALREDRKCSRSMLTEEHARRVCWRVLHDWLRAQLSMIEIGQARIEEIMLPYAVMPDGQTFYDKVASCDFKELRLAAAN